MRFTYLNEEEIEQITRGANGLMMILDAHKYKPGSGSDSPNLLSMGLQQLNEVHSFRVISQLESALYETKKAYIGECPKSPNMDIADVVIEATIATIVKLGSQGAKVANLYCSAEVARRLDDHRTYRYLKRRCVEEYSKSPPTLQPSLERLMGSYLRKKKA